MLSHAREIVDEATAAEKIVTYTLSRLQSGFQMDASSETAILRHFDAAEKKKLLQFLIFKPRMTLSFEIS